MHQIILPVEKPYLVDHINGNGLDNRKVNLRPALQVENLRNRPPTKGKKYKGVYLDKRGNLKKRWSAVLRTKHKTMHLGRYLTIEEAAIAYNKAAFVYFKDFAWLNPVEIGGKIVFGVENK